VAELPVILTPGEDGFIVAECPIIPGCISQGRTREEALENIREAIELCLENRESEGWELPADFEVVRVALTESSSPK
jgi:predicted RNase H-like HicB family nuclease